MNRIETALSYLAGLVLGAFTLIILIEVLFRYALEIPLSWPNELSILLFQWMIFLGAPVALRRGLHFSVEMASGAFPNRFQRPLIVLAGLTAFVVGFALTILSYRMAVSTWDTTYTSLPVPVGVVFVGSAVCGALMAIFAIPLLWRAPHAMVQMP